VSEATGALAYVSNYEGVQVAFVLGFLGLLVICGSICIYKALEILERKGRWI
jgi:hypothetical protein